MLGNESIEWRHIQQMFYRDFIKNMGNAEREICNTAKTAPKSGIYQSAKTPS